MVFIDPFHNFTAAAMEGKWIAPRMGTDAAMAMAIAYVWITEGTYDKAYIETPTPSVSMDSKNTSLEKSTDSPKRRKWAETESTVRARVIRALARQWAKKRTGIVRRFTWW